MKTIKAEQLISQLASTNKTTLSVSELEIDCGTRLNLNILNNLHKLRDKKILLRNCILSNQGDLTDLIFTIPHIQMENVSINYKSTTSESDFCSGLEATKKLVELKEQLGDIHEKIKIEFNKIDEGVNNDN